MEREEHERYDKSGPRNDVAVIIEGNPTRFAILV